jgi:hypothetical protein
MESLYRNKINVIIIYRDCENPFFTNPFCCVYFEDINTKKKTYVIAEVELLTNAWQITFEVTDTKTDQDRDAGIVYLDGAPTHYYVRYADSAVFIDPEPIPIHEDSYLIVGDL